MAMSHHNQTLCTIRQSPFPGDMQNARWIGLGKQVRRVPRDDGEKDMAGEVVLDEIPHRCSIASVTTLP